jgi:hypothetical protein
MKLSNDFSGAIRTFVYFMASGTHNMLEEVEYLELYGNDPGAFEMTFAFFSNVLELDENGAVLNYTYAQRRATDYIKSYCIHEFEVIPPYEDRETELYGPPSRMSYKRIKS